MKSSFVGRVKPSFMISLENGGFENEVRKVLNGGN